MAIRLAGKKGPPGPAGPTGPAGPLGTDILSYPLNGGGVQLATGIQRTDLVVPFDCTITKVEATADQSGSMAVEIWRDTYANYPPTSADKISASAPVTISSAVKSSDATLTGWTKTLTQGDRLRFNVNSVTAITWANIAIHVSRS